MVAMISINTRFLPLNLNLAKPYPVADDRITVKKATLPATINELSALRKKMKSSSGPFSPFQKLGQ